MLCVLPPSPIWCRPSKKLTRSLWRRRSFVSCFYNCLRSSQLIRHQDNLEIVTVTENSRRFSESCFPAKQTSCQIEVGSSVNIDDTMSMAMMLWQCGGMKESGCICVIWKTRYLSHIFIVIRRPFNRDWCTIAAILTDTRHWTLFRRWPLFTLLSLISRPRLLSLHTHTHPHCRL